MKHNQKTQILAFMNEGRSITPLDALAKFSCLRLAARISDLRSEGHNIRTEMVYPDDGNSYARYSIIKT